MNKTTNKRGFLSALGGRGKDVLIMAILAFALFFVSWKVFQEEDGEGKTAASLSESEVKIMRLLREINGVGEASVVVCEDEDGVKSVVVVCEGANDLQVNMNVREAVAAALDTPQQTIKIYLKKE